MRFSHLGSGYFADVYDIEGTAVKVSGPDMCWLLFARYAKRKRSKHLPKIHWVNEIEGGFVAGMEMLRRFNTSMEGFYREVDDPEVMYYVMMNFAYMQRGDYRIVLDHFKTRWPDYKPKFVRGTMADPKYFRHPFVRIMTDMETIDAGCRIDIHWDNVMKRGNDIVVIDPIIRTKEFNTYVQGKIRETMEMRRDANKRFIEQQGIV